MHTMVSKLREKRARDEKGFTLIELLVVVVILGVLIAIAIPLYLNYRKGANDSAAESDMRNAINVLEQCNTDMNKYPTAGFGPSTGVVTAGTCTTQKINLSEGTQLQYVPVGTAGASYTLITNNANGNGKFYCYNSAKGGQVAAIGGTTPPTTIALAVTAGC